MKVINEQALKNKSVIISNEILGQAVLANKDHGLSAKTLFENLLSTLPATKQRKYHIHIIVGYRRWYEWVISYYNYQQNTFTSKPRMRTTIQTLQQYFQKQSQTYKFTSDVMSYLLSSSEKSSSPEEEDDGRGNLPDGVTIQLMNMHDGYKDVSKSFYCHSLPPTLISGLCPSSTEVEKETESSSSSLFQRKNEGSKNSNVQNYYYNFIAIAASQNGLLPPSQQQLKEPAFKSIRRYWMSQMASNDDATNRTISRSLPMICPSEQFYDTILELSIRKEEEIFSVYDRIPTNIADHQEQQQRFDSDMFDDERKRKSLHTEAFEKDKPKFCTLNLDAIVHDGEWQTFFRSLW